MAMLARSSGRGAGPFVDICGGELKEPVKSQDLVSLSATKADQTTVIHPAVFCEIKVRVGWIGMRSFGLSLAHLWGFGEHRGGHRLRAKTF